jgi:uncharacterized protein (TIGR02217 family)
MSDAIFPKLRGIDWGTRITPKVKRTRLTSESDVEVSASRARYPRWKIDLKYEHISEKQPPPANQETDDPVYSDWDTIIGFFLARTTGNETFLFQGVNDIDDARFTVTSQKLGVGDGANKNFQLCHAIGEYLEVVQNPVGTPVIYFNEDETLAGALTDLGNGLWQTTNAPGVGVIVTASFRFAYRCTFDEDEIELENFMAYFWECGSVPLITVKRG